MIYTDTRKQGEPGTSASDSMQLDSKEPNEGYGVNIRPKVEAGAS